MEEHKVLSLEEMIIAPPYIPVARTLPHLVAKEAGKCGALVCPRGRAERGFYEWLAPIGTLQCHREKDGSKRFYLK